MATHTKPDGSPFTPHTAMVLAWRKGDTDSDRAYANGFLIHEEIVERGVQRIALWLSKTMSGLGGTTTIRLSRLGPKFTEELPLGTEWSAVVEEFERRILDELGNNWHVEIRLSAVTERVPIR